MKPITDLNEIAKLLIEAKAEGYSAAIEDSVKVCESKIVGDLHRMNHPMLTCEIAKRIQALLSRGSR